MFNMKKLTTLFNNTV